MYFTSELYDDLCVLSNTQKILYTHIYTLTYSNSIYISNLFQLFSAPIILIPEIELEPDIMGVFKVSGIFVISSNPSNTDRTNIKLVKINSIVYLCVSDFNNLLVC